MVVSCCAIIVCCSSTMVAVSDVVASSCLVVSVLALLACIVWLRFCIDAFRVLMLSCNSFVIILFILRSLMNPLR